MHYMIQPSCKTTSGGLLSLSINTSSTSGGQLIVNTPNPSDRNQLWTPIQYFDNTGAPLGIALVNANTGTAVNASADHGGSAANTVPLASLNQWSTWTLGSNHDGYYALRPFGVDNLNLNVSGNSYANGTPVIVYKWGGGNPNEIWKFVLVDSNPPN